MTKELILLRALPGAGKTSFATLLESMGAKIVAADDFQVDAEGNYDWKPERVKWSHEQCQNTADAYMANGISVVVVHNTFTQEWEMEPYMESARKYGYIVRTLIVENRHGSTNIHDVPDEAIDRMENRFEIKLR